jgi:uncharacterized repeat protein (TIGR03803 family)
MKKILTVVVTVLFTVLSSAILSAQGQLWGLTSSGGDNNSGVLFKANGDGTNFQVKKSLYSGDNPYGSLIEINGKFYYTTSGNGYYGGGIFSYDVGNNSLTAVDGLTHFTSYPSAGSIPLGSLLQFNGSMYGMTTDGGSQSCNGGSGVIFETNPTANFGGATPHTRVRSYNLNGGAKPSGSLVFFNGLFYGLTGQCGANNGGTLFSVSTDFSTTPVTLVNFGGSIGSSNPGALPQGSLTVVTNGKLYGLASRGGASDLGTLFEYTTSLTKRVDFNGSNGAQPCGSVIQAVNGKLYGMTKFGGANNAGTIFEFDPSSNILVKKYDFSATNGQNPIGTLMQAPNGKLYGMTTVGGTSNLGVLFEFDLQTNTYTKRVDFNGANGSYPQYTALVFRKDDQTITFNALPAKSIGCTAFQAGASSSSGLQISYASSNPSVATIGANGMINIVGLGSTLITASQPGNSYYNAAASISQTLNVANKPAASNIWVGGSGAQVCGLVVSFSASGAFGDTFEWGIPAGQVKVAGGDGQPGIDLRTTSPGEKIISVVRTDPSGCPSETGYATYNVTMKSYQQITGVPSGSSIVKTYNDPQFSLPGSCSSGQLQWNYGGGNSDLLSISSSNLATILNAGNETFNVTAPETGCYLSSSQSVGVTILRAPQTLICPQVPATLCDNYTFDVTTTGGVPVEIYNYSGYINKLSSNTFQISSSGSFSFIAADSRNYQSPSGCGLQISIIPKPIITIYTNDQTTFCSGEGLASLGSQIQNLTSGWSIEWLKNNNVIETSGSFFDARLSGDYSMRITQQGCTGISNTITVNAIDCSNFSLYPNPATNEFTIEEPLPTRYGRDYEVWDSMGGRYATINIPGTFSSATFDCSWLPNGLYYIKRYDNSNQTITTKTISISH